MLDIFDAPALDEADWHQLASRAELPCTWQEYMASAGACQIKPDSSRKHCRVALRSIAIMLLDDEQHAAYTKDVSKIGIGFYSPVHLLPRTMVRLWLPGHSLLRVGIARCRRLGERCYECGGVFQTIGQAPRV
jgi:hypothetical protein